MSRGPGQLQRAICDHLAVHPALATYETLRWELFERQKKTGTAADGSPPGLHLGRLPAKWNTSFKRAIDGLAGRGERQLIVERRHLETMEELVRHYPGKSLVAGTRKLRLTLLPVIADIVETAKIRPRYAPAENETFFLREASAEQFGRFQKMWKRLEPELMTQLQRVTGADRSRLFLLIARAISLFEFKPKLLECGLSIAECVGPLVEHAALPPALLKQLAGFADAVVPTGETGFLRLKSYIRSFTDIPSRGSGYRLKDNTLDLLDRACPEVVRTLPDYRPPPDKPGSPWAQYVSPHSRYGDEIHKLIDKTVFEKFVFIRIA
jgi:hypothetical protein